ncbi:LysR substrate-binding domain-containing protein [Micromonospora sp. RP3T]|uniref:LysR substrate-binding domain-containing protein n=1 Tax=Micromonospora sp. RP3T TaxID=2135446 RepID=UPI003D744CD1
MPAGRPSRCASWPGTTGSPGPPGTRNQRSVVAVCRAAGFQPRIRFTALNGASGGHILKDGVAVALTSATLVPPGELHTVRLAEDLRVALTVAWRRGSRAAPTALWLAQWLRDRHVKQLAKHRPDLLAWLRADTSRRPGYLPTCGSEDHASGKGGALC